jgi:hypothetical protein
MKVGYVIGNGTSRKGFDLEKLKGCVTVGCNTAYKEFDPTYLVAIDRHMKDSPIKEIEELYNKKRSKSNPRKWQYVTREMVERWWWMTVDGEPMEREAVMNKGFCHNSGMYGALLLSQVKKFDFVYMLGLDFFRDAFDKDGEKMPNDIYGGTFESHPGLIKVWNHMFAGAPTDSLTGKVIEDRHGKRSETVRANLINTQFIRVGPIEDCDKDYYWNEHPLLECIQNFDDMPIITCED